MSLPYIYNISDFIVKNYSSAKKIVEVGVGANPRLAKCIKNWLPNTRVVVTDIDLKKLIFAKEICTELEIACDDVSEPKLMFYKEADLIYSIHPPQELVSEIFNLALILNSDVLIRPFFNEEGGYSFSKRFGWRLTLWEQAAFYLLRTRQFKKDLI